MKKILNIILKLVLAILVFWLTLVILEYFFQDVINIHNLHGLKWFSILTCFIGFYFSGLITKNLSLKYLPILAIQFLAFYVIDDFYFPFNLILILFAIFGLFLARKEFKKSHKYFSILPFLSVFIFYLLSQPLIIEKEYFGRNTQGDYINAKLIWNFNNSEKSLPDLNLYNVQDKKVDLSNYSDKKIVMTFWATWCGPCLGEKPELENLKTDFEENENIIFIDVSFDENPESWKNYLKKKNPKGIQLISKDIAKDKNSLQIIGIPFKIIVNEKGIYKEFQMYSFIDSILKLDDTVFNAFINQKKQFKEYTPTDKEKEVMKGMRK